MQVTIEIPDVIAADLRENWGDLPRRVLEALAAEGFRKGKLTDHQVMEMLKIETNNELEHFLEGAQPASVELTHETVNLDDPDEWLRFQEQEGRKARERVRKAVRELQDKGILDADGRLIKRDELPPDMLPDSKATFKH